MEKCGSTPDSPISFLAASTAFSQQRNGLRSPQRLTPRVMREVTAAGTLYWPLTQIGRNRGVQYIWCKGHCLKILYHHRTSAQDGSAVHIDGLVSALSAQGVELLMVAPPVAAASGKQPRSLSNWLSRLRRKLPRILHEALELLYNLPEGFHLLRAIRKHHPDAIYERSNLFMVSGALLAPRLGKSLGNFNFSISGAASYANIRT